MALQDTALRLIRKFGEDRQVTLKAPAAVPADPAKPWEVDPTATTSDKTVPAVVLAVSSRGIGRPFERLTDGVSVLDGDEIALIAGISLGSIQPKPNSILLDEGIEKNIITVKRVKPGKTDFLWKLQIRST